MNRNGVAVALVLAIGLGGCATMPNPIAANDRGGMRVAKVAVDWEVPVGDRPQTQAFEFEKRDLEDRLQQDITASFSGVPDGPTLVDLQVHVSQYTRVGALMGNVIGGVNAVGADVDVVRERDGKLVGTYNAVFGMYASNHGLIGAIAQSIAKPDIVGIMAGDFAQRLHARFDEPKTLNYKPTRPALAPPAVATGT